MVYSQLENLSYVLFLPVFIGYLTTSLTYHIKEAIHSKRSHGTYWYLKNSAYLSSDECVHLITHKNLRIESTNSTQANEDAKLPSRKLRCNYFNLFGVFLKAIVMMISHAFKISVMYTAAYAGLSYSLVINLYSLTPFLTAVAFYFLFKERLFKMHLIGMGLLFVCIVITS